MLAGFHIHTCSYYFQEHFNPTAWFCRWSMSRGHPAHRPAIGFQYSSVCSMSISHHDMSDTNTSISLDCSDRFIYSLANTHTRTSPSDMLHLVFTSLRIIIDTVRTLLNQKHPLAHWPSRSLLIKTEGGILFTQQYVETNLYLSCSLFFILSIFCMRYSLLFSCESLLCLLIAHPPSVSH